MRSNIIKKLISSSLALSLILGVGVELTKGPIIVQARDYDDRYDDDRNDIDDRYDDRDDIDDRYDDDWKKPGNVNTPGLTPNREAIGEYLGNVYENIFNRQVDQQGLNYWVNALATGQTELDDFFKNLLSEPEFLQVAPTVEEKIRKIYAGVFQREADKGGLDYWVRKYKEELRDEKNEIEALKEIIEEMTDGDEFDKILLKLGLTDND